MSRRRIAVLVVVVVVAVLVAVAIAERHDDPEVQRRYVDPMGWSLVYPRSMHLERSQATLRLFVTEVTVASFAPVRAVSSHMTPGNGSLRVDPPRDRRGAFPADGIAFRVFRREGGPVQNVGHADTRLPLRLSGFRRFDGPPATDPRPLVRTVIAHGHTYTASAWIGPKAPAHRRAALARVVSSFSFAR